MPGCVGGGFGADPPLPPSLPPPPLPLPGGGPTTGGAFFGGAGAGAWGGFSRCTLGTWGSGVIGLVASAPSTKELNFTESLDPFVLVKPI